MESNRYACYVHICRRRVRWNWKKIKIVIGNCCASVCFYVNLCFVQKMKQNFNDSFGQVECLCVSLCQQKKTARNCTPMTINRIFIANNIPHNSHKRRHNGKMLNIKTPDPIRVQQILILFIHFRFRTVQPFLVRCLQ